MARIVRALETAQVAELAGVPLATLDYWLRTRLVKASIRGSTGRRRTRLWSTQDAVTVRTVKALKDSGAPPRRIKAASKALKEGWGETLGEAVLLVVGRDVLRIGPWGEVSSLVEAPGQQVLVVVALPVGVWRSEAERALRDVKLTA
ncbi:MAG: MerR family transcriptional regulator [bacterium]